MRTFSFLILIAALAALHAPLRAQGRRFNADSLKKAASLALTDTGKINTLALLCEALREKDSAQALSVAREIIARSEKIAWADGKGLGYYLLGQVWMSHNRLMKGEETLEAALKICRGNGNKKLEARAITALAEGFRIAGDLSKAEQLHLEALQIREALGNKYERSNSYKNIGNVYMNKSDHTAGINYFIKALRIDEELGDKHGMATCYNSIGNSYYYQGDYDRAFEYLDKGLTLRRSIGDLFGVVNSYNNIGGIYFFRQDYKKALENYTQAYELNVKNNLSLSMRAASLTNMGLVHEYMGDIDKALEIYMTALKMGEETQSAEVLIPTYLSIGVVYAAKKNYAKADEYISKSLDAARRNGSRFNIKEAYNELTRIYTEKGDYKKALEYYGLMAGMKDSILDEQKAKQISQMDALYQSEKRNREIESLTREGEKKDANLRQKNIILYSVLAGLAMVLLMSFVTARAYNQKKKANLRLEEQNAMIALQKKEIEEKNKGITDSINYAKRIQEAMLPSQDLRQAIFPDSFILLMPRDIVSGDFYWFGTQVGKKFIAAADCTGHGVPGALMSMIGNAYLEEIVHEMNVLIPGKILNELRAKIISSLKQTGAQGESKDGMDMALLAIDEKKNVFEFAGANNPLWKFSGAEFTEIKGDKQPVGFFHDELKPFSNHTQDLVQGDLFYLFTDGFADQFGGPQGKKFKYKQLKELLASLQSLPLTAQKEKLQEAFASWKGQLEQVDDVSIIGIRV